jgi:cell division septum initiation protein DivIVA
MEKDKLIEKLKQEITKLDEQLATGDKEEKTPGSNVL